MTIFYPDSEREQARVVIKRYNELVDLDYREEFILDELQEYFSDDYEDEDEDDNTTDFHSMYSSVEREIYRISGLTEEQKQEIVTIANDAIAFYE